MMSPKLTLTPQYQINKQLPPLGRRTIPHLLHRQKLQMPMRLTRPTMLSRVEKRKQTPLFAAFRPRFQASICRFQIVLF